MHQQFVLKLKNGTEYKGNSFGFPGSVSGEVVFATGMVGYPEAFTDPSFAGQILVLTYPLIGNYGVPDPRTWESSKIHIKGLIVSTYNETPSHWSMKQSLSDWLKKEKVPALEIRDTRSIVINIRKHGVLLGKIEKQGSHVDFHDPNNDNLVQEVSTKKNIYHTDEKYLKKLNGKGYKTVVVIDCGNKRQIVNSLMQRGIRVITVPWNTDPFSLGEKVDGVLVSNGPGDPTMVKETIQNVKDLLKRNIPLFGICLGNQILALAAGGKTEKLKFGHRGQNQPCVLVGTKKCYLTTQNHGYVVSQVPHGFKQWFYNANDNTNEGIVHMSRPVMSVQFHPEATPGPIDTDWIFDEFVKTL